MTRWCLRSAALACTVLLLGLASYASGAEPPETATVPPHVAPMLDLSAEQVLARIEVPDPARSVGEVRLARRGDTDVVQTILQTKLLRRVVAEIRKKETPNWPPDSPQHADSLRYLEALDAAQQQLWAKVPRLNRNADERQKLLIEFVLSAKHAAVVLSEFEATGKDESLRITSRRTIAVLELSREYVARNMRLIAADSFRKDGAALDELVAPLPHLTSAAR